MCLTIACGSYSQPNLDTINVNRTHFINVLDAGLKGKVYKEQRDSLLSIISGYDRLISTKNEELKNLLSQTANQEKQKIVFEKQIANMTSERDAFQKQLNGITKMYQKEKRKSTWFKITTVVVAVVGGTLYLFK